MEQLLDATARVCLRCRSALAFRLSRFGSVFSCQCGAQVADGQKVVSAYYSRVLNSNQSSPPTLPYFPRIEVSKRQAAQISSVKVISVQVDCLRKKAVVSFRNFHEAEAALIIGSLPLSMTDQKTLENAPDGTTTVVWPLQLADTLLFELEAAAAAGDVDFQLCIPPPWVLEAVLGSGPDATPPDSPPSPLPPSLATVLHPHQLDAVKQAVRWGGRVMLADEMGVGKTLAALGIVAALGAFPLLIVAPSALKYMWAEEIEKYLYGQASVTDMHIISGSNDALSANIEETPKVVITSYHMAAALRQQLQSRRWKCVLADESHVLHTSVGGADACYTDLVVALGKASQHCILLSGTPALTTPFDMYNQIDMLHPGLLGETRWHFALRYCRIRMAPYPQVLECERGTEFGTLLRSVCMVRRLKKDVLDLPAKNRIVLKVTSSADGGRHGPGGPSSSFQHRYSQCWKSKRRGIFEAVGYACDKYASVVLFAHHLVLLDELTTFLAGRKNTCIRIDGGVDPSQRAALVTCFDNGEAKVAVMGLTACAVGISLAAAQCAVFCELPPDAAWMLQAEDRLHRFGQESQVSIYYLLGIHSSFDAKHFTELCESFDRVRSVTDGEAAGGLTFAHASRTRAAAPWPVHCDARAGGSAARRRAAVPALAERLLFTISRNTRRIHYKAEAAGGGGSVLYATLSRQEASECVRARSSPVWEQLAAFLDTVDRLSPFQQRQLLAAQRWVRCDFEWAPAQAQGTRKRNRYSLTTQSGIPVAPGGGRGFWWKVMRPGVPVHFYFARLVTLASADGVPEVAQRCLECQAALPRRGSPVDCRPGTVVEIDGDTGMFCGGGCRRDYFVKRSGGAARRSVQLADRGVCAGCHVDCERLCAEASTLSSLPGREALVRFHLPHLEDLPALFHSFVANPTSGNLWHADHVVPVGLGGGEATLANIQTLCVACHALKTQEDIKLIRAARLRGDPGSDADEMERVSTLEVALTNLTECRQKHRVTLRW